MIDNNFDVKINSIPVFRGAIENPKQKVIGLHFIIGNFICAAMVVAFLILLFSEKTMPEFLIGLVGSIIGYYIARPPYDLKNF
ncbi:hypothetical protein HYU07_04225 [Candidatus Woesearchaeota archaeon]|nr:hypothetical protein [Candidatus Woesearchaeota archaeon]